MTAILRFLIYSLIGVVAFFVPLSLGDRSTILMDHIVSFLNTRFAVFAYGYITLLIAVGAALPFYTGRWKASGVSAVLSCLQLLALPLAVMYFLGQGPEAIMQPGMLPFLFEKLAVPVGLIIPVGALMLTFLTGFGLMEAIGTLMEPVMRPLWKTPGRSAVDAVASFAGSYSVGLLLTNRVYQGGGYSAKEAAIIATGFSTVSASFMVVVAKTLQLTDVWNAYFWSTLLVTFSVSVITVRLPPLAGLGNDYLAPGASEAGSRPGKTGSILAEAWREGVQVAGSARPVFPLLWENFVDGVQMAARVVPSILSIGLIGLLLAQYTPVFDVLGILLYPFAWLSQLDDPGLVASALASGLAEMFLPAIQGADLPGTARFTVGVVSVSSVLFFSGSIPCVMATSIPINIGQMVVIWLERTALSIPLAAMLAYIFMPA